MSEQAAPAQVQQQQPEVAADGQKVRKKKTPPLTPVEFTEKINVAEAKWMLIHRFYSNQNKGGLITAPTSPNSTETAALLKSYTKIAKLYEHLHKEHKRRTGVVTKGFALEKFLTPSAVTFFNSAAEFPEELKIIPQAAAGGDGISCISQAISIVTSYIERHGLKKNPQNKTEITFDAELKKLFAPHMSSIDKKKWRQDEEGNVITTQTAVQTLIPRLFDSKVPVHPSLFTEDEKKRMAARGPYLTKRTEANVEARTKARAAEREAEKAAEKARAEKAKAAAQ